MHSFVIDVNICKITDFYRHLDLNNDKATLQYYRQIMFIFSFNSLIMNNKIIFYSLLTHLKILII